MTMRRNSAQVRRDQVARQEAEARGEQQGNTSRPLMPRRGTIWIPSSAIVRGTLPLALLDDVVELDRTMW